MEPIVYLNGSFVALSEARIPVLDRGFIFGDGIYEVVPVYDGVPFRWPQHYARLERSLGKIRIPNPMAADRWTALVNELIARHGWTNQMIYIQVTRGVARRDHVFPVDATPTVFAMASEMKSPSPETIAEGVRCISMTDVRWLHCDIKSVSLLGNVLARQAAADAGVAETVQFRDGFLTEASSSNVWVVRGGALLSPPRDAKILEGIRMGLLEELANAVGLPFRIEPVAEADVRSADELLLTSASKEVLAIVELDGQPIGSGKPGPVFHQLLAAYQDAKQRSADAAAALGAGRHKEAV